MSTTHVANIQVTVQIHLNDAAEQLEEQQLIVDNVVFNGGQIINGACPKHLTDLLSTYDAEDFDLDHEIQDTVFESLEKVVDSQ